MKNPGDAAAFRLSYNYRLDDRRLARVGRATALPQEFTARMDYPDDHTVEMDVVVEDGRPRCAELRIVRNPAVGWLTGAELRRLPLQNWLEFVCANASLVVESNGPDNHLLRPASGEDDLAAVASDVQGATRRRNIDDEFLRGVAAAYKAQPGGVTAVRAEFPASESQAFRWIKRARQLGFLPERGR